mgnify:CR=1 FL=1
MSILTINLKHFYQRRSLWLACIVFGCLIFASIAIPLDRPKTGEGLFIGLVVLAFPLGLLAAALQMEIVTKPFAFSLPGHRRSVRNFVFSIGLVVNAVGSMLFLFYPGASNFQATAATCSAFCAGMVFYLSGVWLIFRLRTPVALLGLLPCAIVAVQFLDLNVLLERTIVDHPVPVILLGLACSAAAWIYPNVNSLARRNCMTPYVGFAEVFNRDKLYRFYKTKAGANRWDRLKDHPRPWVEDFFINTMSREKPLRKARFLWGNLYTSFAVLISQWKAVLFFILLIAVWMGYNNPKMWIILIFAPVFLMLNASRQVVYSNMLVAGGRNERFYASLTVIAAIAVLLIVSIGTAVLISIPLAAIIPKVQYRGVKFAYNPVAITALYAPLVFLPLAHAINLTLHRKPALVLGILMLLAGIANVSSIMWKSKLAVVYGPSSAVTFAVFAWIICVLVLRHVCTRRCLTK